MPNQTVTRAQIDAQATVLQSVLHNSGFEVSDLKARDAVARAHGFKSAYAARCWEKAKKLGIPAEALSEFTYPKLV